MERTFDWHPSQDPRSLKFLLGATSTMCTSTRAYGRTMRTKRVWLDQGREGACTGFGSEHALALSPYSKETSNEQAQRVYHRARFLDEWEGENYEGSSVNGAMLAEREFGRVKSWLWARSTQDIAHALSYHGAGVMGSWWYDGMWNVDINGYVHPTGSQVGGHAYAIGGFETLSDGSRRFRIDNSWGLDWGVQGSAWITEQDLAMLMIDGEFAVPTKVRD